MNLAEFANVASRLVKARDHHQQQADYFTGLFNAHAKQGNPLTDILTPLQQFYQRMCEHHSCQAVKLEREIEQWQSIADGVLFE